MAINFPDEGYRTLHDAGAQEWCEHQLDNFIDYLTEHVPQPEMTVGRIRQTAVEYITQQQMTAEFAPIAQRCDGTDGLFLGVVITMMAEYLKALVLDRFM